MARPITTRELRWQRVANAMKLSAWHAEHAAKEFNLLVVQLRTLNKTLHALKASKVKS